MQYRTLAISLTNTCNMQCAHCITSSSPYDVAVIELAAVLELIRNLPEYVAGLCLTGGEALVHREKVYEILELAKERQLGTALISNGWFLHNETLRGSIAEALERAGLGKLFFSYDRFHEPFLRDGFLDKVIAFKQQVGFQVVVQYVIDGDQENFDLIRARLETAGIGVDAAELVYFGRGAELPLPRAGDIGSLAGRRCAVVDGPTLYPSGRLATCCGPTDTSPQDSPLILSPHTTAANVRQVLDAGLSQRFLGAVHTHGPHWLYAQLPAQLAERIRAQLSHVSLCSLCRALSDDQEAVAFLDACLSENKYKLAAAALIAARPQDSLAS